MFVPAGWQVGLSFELADLWLQAKSVVLDHCPFALFAGRRIDAMVIDHPGRILSCNRRESRRHKVCTSEPITATIWCVDRSVPPDGRPRQGGRLVNWDDGGLRVELPHPVRLDVGERSDPAFVALVNGQPHVNASAAVAVRRSSESQL